jgi:hypothetical protein
MNSPENHMSSLLHRLASKPGLMGKIGAKCIECIYDPCQLGSWRSRVDNRISSTCAPFTDRAKSDT